MCCPDLIIFITQSTLAEQQSHSVPEAFFSDPPPLNTLFSQIPYVLILYSSALRENISWPPSKCFYYLLLIQAPTVRKFKHLMFSTAEYTGTEDTSLGIVYVFIWVYYSWHIHIDSWRELQGEQLQVRGGKSASYSLQISSFLNPQVFSVPISNVNICKSWSVSK